MIYVALGWIGNNLHIESATLETIKQNSQDLGTYILNNTALLTFGELGRGLLVLIVTLACLTTAIGLAVAVSEYFNEVYPKNFLSHICDFILYYQLCFC